MDRDDEEWVPKTSSKGNARPSYSTSFNTVFQNQGGQQNSDGSWQFQSIFDNTVTHQLDSRQREQVPNKDYKSGFKWQKPAMDHVVQFAALQEQYHQMVVNERNKAKQGRARRSSFDLYNAFSDAVKNPNNLRIVTHDEHVQHGGHKQKGQFSKTEQSTAQALINREFVATTSQSDSNKYWQRPNAALPK